MTDDLYDEFGNYIGPELDDESSRGSDSDSDSESDSDSSAGGAAAEDEQEDAMSLGREEEAEGKSSHQVSASAIVLHEDKEHYGQVYDETKVKTVTLTEDAETIETPIVPREVVKSDILLENMTSYPSSTEVDFFGSLLQNPSLKRFVSIVGEFHSGKTSLLDLLVEESVRFYGDSKKADKSCWGEKGALEVHNGGGPRLLDTLEVERERQMSIKTAPLTLMLPDSRHKSHLMTFLDTPGHIHFIDEVTCATALTDGAMIVIDPLEAIISLEHVVPKLMASKQELVLCLNKLDRLILEVKLPPSDMYWKLFRVIDEVNSIVEDYSGIQGYFHPNRNIVFGSSLHGYMFTLRSFANMYFSDKSVGVYNLDVDKFAARLWGNSFYCPTQRKFFKSEKKVDRAGVKERSFVEFILNPIYKLYSVCLGEEQKALDKALRNLPNPILLPKQVLKSSTRTILRSVLGSYIGSLGSVDTFLQLPSPASAWKRKSRYIVNMPVIDDNDTHPLKPEAKKSVVHVTKLLDIKGKFGALCRVYSGSLKVGQRVQILGNAYPGDLEDVTFKSITAIHVPTIQSSKDKEEDNISLTYRSQDEVNGGNIVILHGIDSTISHSATIISSNDQKNVEEDEDLEQIMFKPLHFDEAVIKLSIEPLRPAELPKMVQGLRSVLKSYPASQLVVHDTGEHCVFGTGELYLDTLMQFLRSYSDIEIKVAEPTVALRESVSGTSLMGVVGETPNHRNKLTVTTSPLEEPIVNALVDRQLPEKEDGMPGFFMQEFGWDLLSSRSIWAFDYERTSLLLDDTIPDFNDESSKNNLTAAKPGIVQGFRWAAKEGPLCDEPLHGCKIKLLDAVLAPSAVHRSSGQIIPTIRRTVHASILLATPILLEPINKLYITTPTAIVDSLTPVLTKRRGYMTSDSPIGASTYSIVTAYIPVMDSFGFETDIRTYTQGQAMVQSVFEYWNDVPGDAMDTSIVLHPLEPSPPQCLAREFLVKTRRRKGLSEDVSVNKYLDEEMKRQLILVQRGEDSDNMDEDDSFDKGNEL